MLSQLSLHHAENTQESKQTFFQLALLGGGVSFAAMKGGNVEEWASQFFESCSMEQSIEQLKL